MGAVRPARELTRGAVGCFSALHRGVHLGSRVAWCTAAIAMGCAADANAQQATQPPPERAAPMSQSALGPTDGGTIVGDVVAAGDGRPLAYATVLVEPGGRKRFADAGGAFAVGPLAPGPYSVRIRQIGFAASDTTVTVGAGAYTRRLRIVLKAVAIKLPEVTVLGNQPTKCLTPGVPDSSINPRLAELFAELQKNVDRYRLLVDAYPFEFSREEWRVLRNDAGYEETLALDTVRYEVRDMESRPYKPGTVVVWEIGPHGRTQQYMPLPTFRYLGDSAFQRAHCFQYVGEDTAEGDPVIRVDFQPAASIRTPDLEGSVYLDEDRYIVRRAEFRVTEPNRIVPPISELTVTTTFREIVPLVPLFDEVRYRRPIYKTGDAAVMEVDRLLLFKFEHGAPGSRGTD
jgi:hypothetical protein